MLKISRKIFVLCSSVLFLAIGESCQSTSDQEKTDSISTSASNYDTSMEAAESIPAENEIDSNKVKDILERGDFFLREGDYLIIDQTIEKGPLISSEKYNQKEWEADERSVIIHHYESNARSLTSGQLSMLNRTVIYGGESENFKKSKTQSFRTLNEELTDSLEGIWLPEKMCEPSFYWIGEKNKFSADHSVIKIDTDELITPEVQWAILSDNDPIIFKKAKLKNSDKNEIYTALVEEEYHDYSAGVLLFSYDSLELVVTYNIYDECGYEYYENITLWNSTPTDYTFIKELENVPLLIFDVDKDQDIDILYDLENLYDSHDFIEIDYPGCQINGTDTSYYCGC